MATKNGTGKSRPIVRKTANRKATTATKPETHSKPPGAKRAVKSVPVPNVGIGESWGWKGRLFVAEDILAFAELAGVKVLSNDHEALSWKLHGAFENALTWVGNSGLVSPPSEWRDWLIEVHKRADALLEILGFQTGIETILGYDRFQKSNLALWDEMRHANLPLHFGSLPEQVRDVFQHYPKQKEYDNPFEIAPALHWASLRMAPWIIAYISEIGRQGSVRRGGMRGKKLKEPFTRQLFQNLAEVYQEMAGTPPSGMKEFGDRVSDAPPIIWVKAVLAKAVDREPSAMLVPVPGITEAIRAAAGLSATRIIDLFSTKRIRKNREENVRLQKAHDRP